MNNFLKGYNSVYKKIDYLLKSVNLSLEIISVLRTRKIYRLLKKISIIIDNFELSKQDLKEIAILIASGHWQKRKAINKIAKFVFQISVIFKKNIIYKKEIKKVISFWEKFFDKKQIIRC